MHMGVFMLHHLLMIYRTQVSLILEGLWIQMLKVYEIQGDINQDAMGFPCVYINSKIPHHITSTVKFLCYPWRGELNIHCESPRGKKVYKFKVLLLLHMYLKINISICLAIDLHVHIGWPFKTGFLKSHIALASSLLKWVMHMYMAKGYRVWESLYTVNQGSL